LSKPLVSVVVPTFNSERFLERCLKAIKAQSYPNIEIIVVDSHSADRTREIAENLGAVVIATHAKRSEARNLGAEKAHGELLFFVDADMELASSVISECVAKVGEGYDGIIIPELSIGTGFWAKCKALEKACYIEDDLMEAARFFKKSVFQRARGYDNELEAGEDWDLSLRIGKMGKIGRVTVVIKHNVRELRLQEIFLKKHYYGKTLRCYQIKHPEEARIQLSPNRLSFVKHWRRLANDPTHACGMLFMKLCEFSAGGLGFITTQLIVEK
jgi:glycosyltransferase involved in cell wall biosynthesis